MKTYANCIERERVKIKMCLCFIAQNSSLLKKKIIDDHGSMAYTMFSFIPHICYVIVKNYTYLLFCGLF